MEPAYRSDDIFLPLQGRTEMVEGQPATGVHKRNNAGWLSRHDEEGNRARQQMEDVSMEYIYARNKDEVAVSMDRRIK